MSTYHSTPPIDEHTPLLDGHGNGQTLPAIFPVIARVSTSHEIPIDDLIPYPLSDQSTEVAFTLAVLLQLRHAKIQSFNAVGAYECWFQTNRNTNGVDTLEKQILRVWTRFLEQYRDVREVETVLWTQFPIELGGLKTTRGLSTTSSILCSTHPTFCSCRFPGKFSRTDLPSHHCLEPFSYMAAWCSHTPSVWNATDYQ
jgi:hypothetical protein